MMLLCCSKPRFWMRNSPQEIGRDATFGLRLWPVVRVGGDNRKCNRVRVENVKAVCTNVLSVELVFNRMCAMFGNIRPPRTYRISTAT